MDYSNADISSRLREGDPAIYDFLFRKYYVPLCVYAKRYVGRNDVAEEVVADTFFHIWNNRSSLQIHSSVKAYLFQAVCNNSLSYLRKLKKEELIEDFFQDTSWQNAGFACLVDEISQESLIFQETYDSIKNAINLLPPQQQAVFKYKRLEGKKIKEIAAIMNISVKTVEMHLSRALINLRHLLKEYLPAFLLFWVNT